MRLILTHSKYQANKVFFYNFVPSVESKAVTNGSLTHLIKYIYFKVLLFEPFFFNRRIRHKDLLWLFLKFQKMKNLG